MHVGYIILGLVRTADERVAAQSPCSVPLCEIFMLLMSAIVIV